MLPDYLVFTDGMLTVADPTSATAGGCIVAYVTATDYAGWSTRQLVAIDIGLKHEFGDD